MAQAGATAEQMIPQLEAARRLALADPSVYKQIFPGILPLVGSSAPVQVQRWGADFFAEGFASPAFANVQKEEIIPEILSSLRQMLNRPGSDIAVVKSLIQVAASIYPLVFRRVTSHPDQAMLWQDMTAMKMNVLTRMENAPLGVRVCCIKFMQKVIQTQTPGLIADPRRPEQNETSIALVPRNHPLLQLPILEAEASGLLDRLLSIFQDHGVNDPILVDATMNCLSILIRTRPAGANKIISAILNFNPLKQANTPLTPKTMVAVKSMERTTRALLRNVNKHNPNGPLASKIDSYLLRLNQSRAAIFSETPSLKRPAPSEPVDGLDDAKRIRLTGSSGRFPPMPPPPNSFADLFTLTEDVALKAFDVKLLQPDIVTTITAALLQHIDSPSLDDAVAAVKARYTHLQKASRPTPVPDIPLAGPTGIDDEDDYDPEYDPGAEAITAPSTEKVLDELAHQGPVLDLGPFELPKPPPISEEGAVELYHQSINHVFGLLTSLENLPSNRQKLGLNRWAASSNDRDAWVTLMTRLATRTPAGLDKIVKVHEKDKDDEPRLLNMAEASLANSIRQTLYNYIVDNFRPRLNVAISWLNEEWYADKIQAKADDRYSSLPNYYHWATKLLDNLLPYLDVKDSKLLIRFVSEIPAINEQILDRVASLARDPERVSMSLMALQYLLMFRLPVRSMVIDTVTNLWKDSDFSEARSAAAKVLGKWRPEVLKEDRDEEKMDGVKKEDVDDQARQEQYVDVKAQMNGLKSPVSKVEREGLDSRKGLGAGRQIVAVGDERG